MPNRKMVQLQKAQPAPFMSPKQAFVQSLAWSIPITWFDRQGLHRLDDDRVAVLTLEIQGTIGSYSGFQVEIISKTRGKLFQKYFNFNDYLPPINVQITEPIVSYASLRGLGFQFQPTLWVVHWRCLFPALRRYVSFNVN